MKMEWVWTSKASLAMPATTLRQRWSLLSPWISFQCPSTLLRWSNCQKCIKVGPGWAYQSHGPYDFNQTKGADILLQPRPHKHKIHAQGGHGECQLHHGGPGQVHEDLQSEEAHKGSRRVFFYRNNFFVHTAAVLTTRITARWFQV